MAALAGAAPARRPRRRRAPRKGPSPLSRPAAPPSTGPTVDGQPEQRHLAAQAVPEAVAHGLADPRHVRVRDPVEDTVAFAAGGQEPGSGRRRDVLRDIGLEPARGRAPPSSLSRAGLLGPFAPPGGR